MVDRVVGLLVGFVVEFDEDVKDGDGDVVVVGLVVDFEGSCDIGLGLVFVLGK